MGMLLNYDHVQLTKIETWKEKTFCCMNLPGVYAKMQVANPLLSSNPSAQPPSCNNLAIYLTNFAAFISLHKSDKGMKNAIQACSHLAQATSQNTVNS